MIFSTLHSFGWQPSWRVPQMGTQVLPQPKPAFFCQMAFYHFGTELRGARKKLSPCIIVIVHCLQLSFSSVLAVSPELPITNGSFPCDCFDSLLTCSETYMYHHYVVFSKYARLKLNCPPCPFQIQRIQRQRASRPGTGFARCRWKIGIRLCLDPRSPSTMCLEVTKALCSLEKNMALEDLMNICIMMKKVDTWSRVP